MNSLHLLLPLLASILFVIGLMLIKRASSFGIKAWTVTFLANMWAAAVFSTLLLLEGSGQPWTMLWQPGVIALLYLSGQVSTFLAIHHGDVSVATPVFSVKVLLVAVLVTVVNQQALSWVVWVAAALATLGIVLVQASRSEKHERVTFTVVFALLAAMSFSMFDILVSRWAPAWGTGRLLPAVFGIAAVLSLGFVPWIDRPQAIAREGVRLPLLIGTLFIALQAMCIVFTLAAFGDAARVNVVYALRGLWGVVLAWQFARVLGAREADLPRKIMIARLIGAALLTGAVILAILASERPDEQHRKVEQAGGRGVGHVADVAS
jgi:drug/metabolite transporter (DMT)-like permease